jgi:hypothetical protein
MRVAAVLELVQMVSVTVREAQEDRDARSALHAQLLLMGWVNVVQAALSVPLQVRFFHNSMCDPADRLSLLIAVSLPVWAGMMSFRGKRSGVAVDKLSNSHHM